MNLYLKDLKKDKAIFDYYIENIDDIKIVKPIHIVGTANFNGDKVIINGTYDGVIKTQCIRCLEDIDLAVKGAFQGIYLDKFEYEKYLKSLKNECEIKDIYDEIIDGVIDIDSLVREYILLQDDPICEPHCINDLTKEYSSDIDSRWQQLLDIKIN